MARSAGIVVYRTVTGRVEVLIAHMGGPFWARKDTGAWSIPKGEYDATEDPYAAARREFREELGSAPPEGQPIDLGEIRQSSGKVVRAWAINGDLDVSTAVSNTVTIEWPRASGQMLEIPEVDRVDWVEIDVARDKLVKGQEAFLDRLLEELQP